MGRLIVSAALVIGLVLAGTGVVDLTYETESAEASPGGLDSNGCHTCRTNCAQYGISTGFYHRHDPVRACSAQIAQPTAEPPAPEPTSTSVPAQSPSDEQPPPDQQPPPEEPAPQTEGGTTSEVLGVTSAPDAGFGPSAFDAGTNLSWLIAGLIGAGAAWLIAGLAGAKFTYASPARVATGEPANNTENENPRPAPSSSLFSALPSPPLLVRPREFRKPGLSEER